MSIINLAFWSRTFQLGFQGVAFLPGFYTTSMKIVVVPDKCLSIDLLYVVRRPWDHHIP